MTRPTLSEASRVSSPPPRQGRKERHAVRLAEAKRNRRRFLRARIIERRESRERYRLLAARQLELHGVEGVKARKARWAHACYERHRGNRPRGRWPNKAERAATFMAAIVAAKGDTHKAAAALGLRPKTLQVRIKAYLVTTERGEELISDWLARTWPVRAGRKSVEVTDTWTVDGVRVYVLAAHGDVIAGAHVNRVPISGSRPRGRVVCKVCKEARSQ